MSFRQKKATHFELNVIPLVDIVLVLLIFFMLTANFNKITQVNISLPKVDNEQQTANLHGIDIKVTAEGKYFINEQPLLSVEKLPLANAILKISGEDRNIPFIISGDSMAPHQAVVTALDVAGELGFHHVRINSVKTA